MYETKNVRPYYTVAHLGVFGARLKDLTGFEYKDSLYITSSSMNNEGYHTVEEMKRASKHFELIWRDDKKTEDLLNDIETHLAFAKELEEKSFATDWKEKNTEELMSALEEYFEALFTVFTRMIVTQPQHVASLDQSLQALLANETNKDDILEAALRHEKSLPWNEEDLVIQEYHKTWSSKSTAEQEKILELLVERFGWFNSVEGDGFFTTDHYRKKIIKGIEENRKSILPDIKVPVEVQKVASLIAELSYLRLWNRYHFMTLRFCVNTIRKILIERSKEDFLEFATIAELLCFLRGETVDKRVIQKRAQGYVSFLHQGSTHIVVGEDAEKLKEIITEEEHAPAQITGVIANKGSVTGTVRIVSFTSDAYTQEVEDFVEGEILVTGMTRPQIIHLCRKAAAIITDEGGVTCHAAVVSRELGIPCIIATHNATRWLQTGDVVMVDANNGIITKQNT
jgi:phosphoenolpyruvate synthase/pyruvate phosphate dikinase